MDSHGCVHGRWPWCDVVRVVSVAVGDEQYDFVGVWVCGRREVIGQGWERIAVEQGTWGWGSVTVML